jgi:thiol-disulfide isomerase/thioredoxin
MLDSGNRRFVGLLLIAVAVGLFATSLAFLVSTSPHSSAHHRGGLGPGNPAPPVHAEGWLNGSDPTPGLHGKVYVIDAWAYWCGPCLKAAPELVSTYQKFRDRGVLFVGLTSDSEDARTQMEGFIKQGKIPWPCGYGAGDTLMALETHFIPQAWVVGRDGVITWNFDSEGTMDAAIEAALAAPATR